MERPPVTSAKPWRNRRRTLLAFLAAGLTPATITSVFAFLNRSYNPVSVLIFIAGVAYLLQSLVAIPLYLLSRGRRLSLATYMVAGALTALTPFAALVFVRSRENSYTIGEMPFPTLYVAFLGAAAGATFWLATRPRA